MCRSNYHHCAEMFLLIQYSHCVRHVHWERGLIANIGIQSLRSLEFLPVRVQYSRFVCFLVQTADFSASATLYHGEGKTTGTGHYSRSVLRTRMTSDGHNLIWKTCSRGKRYSCNWCTPGRLITLRISPTSIIFGKTSLPRLIKDSLRISVMKISC